jgi:hypothetical protein
MNDVKMMMMIMITVMTKGGRRTELRLKGECRNQEAVAVVCTAAKIVLHCFLNGWSFIPLCRILEKLAYYFHAVFTH